MPSTPCVSYWDDPTLDKRELKQLLRSANAQDVGFSIASFSGTPVSTIRAAIAESDVVRSPTRPVIEPAGLAALC